MPAEFIAPRGRHYDIDLVPEPGSPIKATGADHLIGFFGHPYKRELHQVTQADSVLIVNGIVDTIGPYAADESDGFLDKFADDSIIKATRGRSWRGVALVDLGNTELVHPMQTRQKKARKYFKDALTDMNQEPGQALSDFLQRPVTPIHQRGSVPNVPGNPHEPAAYNDLDIPGLKHLSRTKAAAVVIGSALPDLGIEETEDTIPALALLFNGDQTASPAYESPVVSEARQAIFGKLRQVFEKSRQDTSLSEYVNSPEYRLLYALTADGPNGQQTLSSLSHHPNIRKEIRKTSGGIEDVALRGLHQLAVVLQQQDGTRA